MSLNLDIRRKPVFLKKNTKTAIAIAFVFLFHEKKGKIVNTYMKI